MTSPTPDAAPKADAPPPTFDAMALSADVRRAVDEMGWVQPTSVQLATYELAVARRDLVVQSRTGTGKTAAFGIPLIDRLVRAEGGVQALILAPTRELALQSAKELERIGKHRALQTTAIYGGAPIEKQVRQLRKGAQIVSGTPGRVLDHLHRGTLDPSGIRILVLDEADEMLSMGFAKELHEIVSLLPAERQTLLFSATIDGAVRRLAAQMKDPEMLLLSGDQVGAEGITHFTYFVSGRARDRELVRILEIEDPESALVFCNTKAATESLAATLQQSGFDADWLNGDLPQSDREKVMDRTRRGELRFLVATDVAARGIDVSHLTHVINFDFPETAEQYIHRTGRTGRAGRTGTAISLVSPQELGTLYYLRLQTKIQPIERSVPSAGEERTRLEADRVAMLEGAFRGNPKEIDLAVARRLLTHPAAERLLAGLLSAFFGGKGDDVDELAAAARRSRPPAPVATARPESAERGAAPAPRRPAPTQPPSPAPAPRPSPAAEATRRPPADTQESEGDDDRGDDSREHTTLYLNVGRRDGVRAEEIRRMLEEQCHLGRDAIGRIKVRDRHTLAQVPPEAAAGVMSALAGQRLGDRELVVEPARSQS